MSNSRLHRSPVDRWIGGVCGGIAETYGWDPVIVRLAVTALGLAMGWPILFYIVAWVVIPQA